MDTTQQRIQAVFIAALMVITGLMLLLVAT